MVFMKPVVLLSGSVLTSDVGRTFGAELDAEEETHCEDSRVNVSASDPAVNDAITGGQYFSYNQLMRCI